MIPSCSFGNDETFMGGQNLIWKTNESREMFGSLQLWPSFIGTNIVSERHEIGRLPVFIWPEQSKYVLSTQEGEVKRGVKRRNSETNECLQESESTKRPRLEESASFVGTVLSWMHRIGSWFQPNSSSSSEENDEHKLDTDTIYSIPSHMCFRQQVFDDLHSGSGFRHRNEKWKEDWMVHVNSLKKMRDDKRIQDLSELNELNGEDVDANEVSQHSLGNYEETTSTVTTSVEAENLELSEREATFSSPTTCEAADVLAQEEILLATSSVNDPVEISPLEIPPSLSSREELSRHIPNPSGTFDSQPTEQPTAQANIESYGPKRNQHKRKKQSQQKVEAALPSAEGYMVGPADVYGGDYSLYKTTDPSKAHSVATVRLIESNMRDCTNIDSSTAKINIRDLVAFARVQHQVGKLAVLAFPLSGKCKPIAGRFSESPGVFEKSNGSSDDKSTVDKDGNSCRIGYLAFNFKGVSEKF